MEKKYKLTVFTPAYNRAHTLPRLYNSLLEQVSIADFEWLLIDDCSSDGTSELVTYWIDKKELNIRYIKLTENEGKPRTINRAVAEASSEYLFIVDSDDYLVPQIIPRLLNVISDICDIPDICGIGVLQSHPSGQCFAKPKFTDYVDATNLQREDYGLNFDCNELYKISVLKKYPFYVWPGETFTPEATVFNAIALDNYKVRWLNMVGVVAEYLEDGLTKGSLRLEKKNPMGYALLYNFNLLHTRGLRRRFMLSVRFSVQCFLGRNPSYILKSNSKLLTFLGLPVSLFFYLRRLWQLRSV